MNDQFQIGDAVLYKPEGIITHVIGYLWKEVYAGPPEISGYKLDCGITVIKKHLGRA